MTSWDPEKIRRMTQELKSAKCRAAVALAFSPQNRRKTLRRLQSDVIPHLTRANRTNS